MSNSISVCMIVKNEEQLIGNCLGRVVKVADEIIVVDTGSKDRTVEIAQGLGARIIHHSWDGNYGQARNVYMRAARGDWILVLDGDEAIAYRDLAKINRLVRRRSLIGYCLAIRNYTDDHDLMWNWYPNDRTYSEEEKLSGCPGWVKTQPLRLFRNLPGLKYSGDSAHTSPIASLRKHAGRIENRDDLVIHHFQYLKGGGRFISSKQGARLELEILNAKKFPDDLGTYLNIAKTMFAEKRDDEAVKYLRQAVQLDDSFHDAYQLWGMIELENGRFSSAEKLLRNAIRIDPNSANAWAILGMVLVEDGRTLAAAAALRRAIRIRPQHLLAHNSLGVVYEDLGMHDEARQEYQTALALHPRFKPAKANLARLARSGKRKVSDRGAKG